MAIITTTEVKTLKNITTPIYDSYINSLIAPVQDLIEKYLDRKLDIADYYEWVPFATNIFTEQFPINNIKYIGSAVKVAEFNSTEYNYEVTSTGIIITDNSIHSTTFLFSAYSTVSELKTIIEATFAGISMAIESGYTATSYKLLKPGTGRVLYGATRLDATTKIIEPRTIEFLTSIEFTSYISNYLYMVYSAGYATANMPQGLKKVAADLIYSVVNNSVLNFNGGKTHETIGNFNYTISDGTLDWIGRELERYYDELWLYRKKSI